MHIEPIDFSSQVPSARSIDVQCKVLSSLILGGTIDMPKYGTEQSAGLDLRACIEEDIVLLPGESKLIPTGLAIWIKDPDWVGLLMPRSGLGAKQGYVLGNGTGVIDADYQNEWFISCCNRNLDKPIVVRPNDRIAQLLLVPCAQANFEMVIEFSDETSRKGGFGSTGIN